MTARLYDIIVATEMLDEYKETHLEIPPYPIADSDLYYLSQKRNAVDDLAAYIGNHGFEAPIRVLIEDYIYAAKVACAGYPRDSEAYELYRIKKEMAEEIIIYFL